LLVEVNHPELSVRRQCELLGLARSTFYDEPTGATPEDLHLMRLIDELYTDYPFYGSRRITEALTRRGEEVNRKRVQRLMRFVGLAAVYQRPNTASSRLRTRSIRICSAGCRASGSTKSGAPTWPGAFSTRWSSELGEPRHVSVALQHARRRFLRHGSGGSPGPLPQARDLQHRQGCQFRLERRGITISMDGNGWEWPLRRPHLRRAAVAQPEV
jgi:hypothetical protein